MVEEELYYIIYPEPPRKGNVAARFPANLEFEGFKTAAEAREVARKLDKEMPGRDFVVVKGQLVGWSSGDHHDGDFLKNDV